MRSNLKTAAAALAIAVSASAVQAANIVEIAAGDERFSTLVAAVTAAGLAETLSGPGPFTVYAPVNDAFAALPAGTVESLLEPANKALLPSHHGSAVFAGAGAAGTVKFCEV